MTRRNPGYGPTSLATRFWCPYCQRVVVGETKYDHSYKHQDVAPYAHLVTEEMWAEGLMSHCIAEGIRHVPSNPGDPRV